MKKKQQAGLQLCLVGAAPVAKNQDLRTAMSLVLLAIEGRLSGQ
jgi:hypothetical protein